MKFKYCLFPALLCFGIASQAQQIKDEPEKLPVTTTLEDDAIYNAVETAPDFPGGITAFYKYIANNYRMPEEYVNGKVIVVFVIEKNGSLTDIKVIRDPGYGTGAEAIRVLKNCPVWKPGMQNGRNVRTRYTLPIAINIPDKPSEEEKVYDTPETTPQYPGGIEAFYTSIRSKLHMPESFKGTSEIIVEFIIEKDGKIYSAWINKDIGGDSAAQALMILKQPPLWKPGMQDGKAVRTRLIIPIEVSSK